MRENLERTGKGAAPLSWLQVNRNVFVQMVESRVLSWQRRWQDARGDIWCCRMDGRDATVEAYSTGRRNEISHRAIDIHCKASPTNGNRRISFGRKYICLSLLSVVAFKISNMSNNVGRPWITSFIGRYKSVSPIVFCQSLTRHQPQFN